MTIREARDLIIDLVRDSEARLHEVRAHYGRFNKEWLDELAGRAPCAAVAVLGWPRNEPMKDGRIRLGIRMAIFVVSRSTQTSDAEELLTDIAENLTSVLHNHRPGPEVLLHVGRIQALGFENLTGAAEVSDGLALGSISLTLPVSVGTDPDFSGLFDDLEEIPDEMDELNEVTVVGEPTPPEYGSVDLDIGDDGPWREE